MAVNPKFAATVLGGQGTPQEHTIELYLDYVCKFSAKLFKQYYTNILPLLQSPKYRGKVRTVFRHQVQAWHPSSTLVHETGILVARLAPEKFWEFSEALFERQNEYFDVSVINETRNQTYRRLSDLASSITSIPSATFYDALAIPNTPAPDGSLNLGNEVTNDLKLHIKAARLVGVHVSPTVVFNGVVENSISSGWTVEQWTEWLEKNVV
jgi:protein-disulfide isomerase